MTESSEWPAEVPDQNTDVQGETPSRGDESSPDATHVLPSAEAAGHVTGGLIGSDGRAAHGYPTQGAPMGFPSGGPMSAYGPAGAPGMGGQVPGYQVPGPNGHIPGYYVPGARGQGPAPVPGGQAPGVPGPGYGQANMAGSVRYPQGYYAPPAPTSGPAGIPGGVPTAGGPAAPGFGMPAAHPQTRGGQMPLPPGGFTPVMASATPPKKSSVPRILGMIFGVLVVVIIGGLVAVSVTNWMHRPEVVVTNFLDSLEKGEAAEAAQALDLTGVAGDDSFLKNSKLLQSVSKSVKFSKAHVREEKSFGDTQVIAVDIVVADHPSPYEFIVKRTGKRFGLFDEWSITNPSVVAVTLEPGEVESFDVEGIPGKLNGSSTFLLYPGQYQMTLRGPGGVKAQRTVEAIPNSETVVIDGDEELRSAGYTGPSGASNGVSPEHQPDSGHARDARGSSSSSMSMEELEELLRAHSDEALAAAVEFAEKCGSVVDAANLDPGCPKEVQNTRLGVLQTEEVPTEIVRIWGNEFATDAARIDLRALPTEEEPNPEMIHLYFRILGKMRVDRTGKIAFDVTYSYN
ncbi:hypothetical protein G7Y41_03460 [Schaalia sp. ZJ405]|uniref:hypothetical protein n=1 Tax=Schaalia sp. ZJ405 TaxID=2709403 RepID=UPI0013EDDFC8|nr:hypothetical protein [Schaalia sp. ZJ405]QPK81891.1 hypothetical protein G7Y41_03460 [Schaalia sp. ZJ405]